MLLKNMEKENRTGLYLKMKFESENRARRLRDIVR